MSKNLKLTSELGKSSINYNSLLNNDNILWLYTCNGQYPIENTITLPDTLTITLTNPCNNVIINGQFLFALTNLDGDILPSESFGVTINVFANNILVFNTTNLISGIRINSYSEFNWSVPILFTNTPPLSCIESTVNYTIEVSPIINFAAEPNDEDSGMFIKQYSFFAKAIA